jgi:group II intron reverse transcriptase/maturase
VDGETWREYGKELERNIDSLSRRLKAGAYRAKPVKRAYIPKADGKKRPLGITALEDKIVQTAVVQVMNAIYETDFLGFSYGFRPGRSPHRALDALSVGLTRKKVNWVLDADIRGFFDSLDHECLLRFIRHRIADTRLLKQVEAWLRVGVVEDGVWRREETGSPQGGCISPVLANVYLHYVFDLWAQHWRTHRAQGEVVLMRYADDFVVGFQRQDDAERFREELQTRMERFGLELHAEKTRLIEFGRYARSRQKCRGKGKPETFDFLGFTHICGETRKGGFCIRRQTVRKRMRDKVKAVKLQLRKRLHTPIPIVGTWLGAVVRGHFNYYGVPGNQRLLSSFKYQIYCIWFKALRRRSQRRGVTAERMFRLAARYLPPVRVVHPYPGVRLRV